MRITRVDVYPITLQLAKPMVMANQVIDRSHNVLVRLATDDGLVGWGEGVEAVAVTRDTQDEIATTVRHLGDTLLGADPLQHHDLWRGMRRSAPSSTTAIAALDIALHDLAGHALGVPVSEIIGDPVRNTVPALQLIGGDDVSTSLNRMLDGWDEGFRWFKLKLALTDPDQEVDALTTAAAEMGPGGVLCGDANEGWDVATAESFLDQLSGVDVRFIEQPIPRQQRESFAHLAERSPVPLCADESARSLSDLEDLASIGLGGVSLKLIKHLGISGVMKGAAMCADLGLAINLAGKVAETSIAAAANLHCAATIPSLDYGCSPANQGLVSDVTENPPHVVDGSFPVPSGPGLGVDVAEDRVKALATS